MKIKYYITIILIIILLSLPVSAAEISIGTAKLDGHTQYIIQGDQSGGFKSKLIFPLEQVIYKFDYSVNLNNYLLESIKLTMLKSRDSYDYSGKFLDSDWLYSRYEAGKDIYSESDAYLDFRSLEAEVIFTEFYQNSILKSNLSLGYLDQSFDFIVKDLFQYNYYNNTATEIEGEVLAYRVDYNLPYLGLQLSSINSKSGKLNYTLKFRYSPFLKAEDFDDHILRDKLSYIDAEGSAYLLGAEFSYQISKNLNLLLAYDYAKFEASGTQIQTNYYDTVLFEDIDAKIESEQKSITAALAYLF